MRALLVVLRMTVLAIGIGLAITIARRFVGPRSEGHSDAQEETYGGAVNVDSIRAVRAAILRHLTGPDSYIPAMLVESDSLLRRWPDEHEHPLRVHILPGRVPGYRDDLGAASRAAFVRWEQVGGIPVHFEFVNDSGSAEVLVRWVDRFPLRRAGQADIRWNGEGWIVSATLTLATHTSEGIPLEDDAVYTVALHEIGHLLGLGHSDNANDVMYPTTSVHDITGRDRNTARLLYSVPPGYVRLGAVGQ